MYHSIPNKKKIQNDPDFDYLQRQLAEVCLEDYSSNFSKKINHSKEENEYRQFKYRDYKYFKEKNEIEIGLETIFQTIPKSKNKNQKIISMLENFLRFFCNDIEKEMLFECLRQKQFFDQNCYVNLGVSNSEEKITVLLELLKNLLIP